MGRSLAFARRGMSAVGALFFAVVLASNTVWAGPTLASFSAGDFVPGAAIDNPYFPLVPGTLHRYEGLVTDPDSGETTLERAEDFVTFETIVIADVVARIVRAKSYADDVLVEDTFDYFAQDKLGNVWYLGEDTTAYEYGDDGKLVGTDTAGSFRAGVNGAQGGFIMPADLPIGFNYYQEFAAAEGALDQATILSLNESVTGPTGSYTNVLKTFETSELEPSLREHKYYALGIGLVLIEEDVNDAGQALNTIPLQSVTVSAVPLPPAALAGLVTMILFTLPTVVRANLRRRMPAA
jgi:hypothetical protein